jgi:hypothetical protein
MPQSPGNHFANYQPPGLGDIFSPAGKIEIIQYKVERLAERVKAEMLEGDNVEEFVNGTYSHDVDYDCTSLESFITFSRPDDELDFVGSAVTTGLCAALMARKVPETSGRIGVAGHFSDEDPRIANIMTRFFKS